MDWTKIERAREHSAALQQYVGQALASSNTHARVGLRFEPATSEYVLYVAHMPELDGILGRASAILGDALGNYRAALDHLASQLADKNTSGRVQWPDRVQFPIVDNPKSWEKARKSQLRELHPAHQAIIESFQGYHRVHEQVSVGLYFHPLVRLRDLCNTDKHRRMTPVCIPSSGLTLHVGDLLPLVLAGAFQATSQGGTLEGTPIELGTELVRAALPETAYAHAMDDVGIVSPALALDDGRAVAAVLKKIDAVIEMILREFDGIL